jgi:hypothetical protein
MNVSKFLQESAKFMASDRPDLWTKEDAFDLLSTWFATLAGEEGGGEISTGGFALTKREDDGYIEYELHRKIAQFCVFPEEEETSLFDWSSGGSLVDVGLDLEEETS